MARETQAQRIARIEEENARLRAEIAEQREALEAASAETAAAEAAAAAAASAAERVPPRRSRGRAVASVALVLIGALLAPVALVASTSQRLLTDSDYFVETVAPIVDEEAVQELIIAEATAAIRNQAGLDDLVARLFDGLDELGLPPRTTAALQLLERPAAEGLGAVVERVVTEVVTSERFTEIIRESLRIGHEQLVAALAGTSSTVTIGPGGEVGIALEPLIDRVRTALTDAGFPLASLIPRTDAVIVVATSEQLAQLAWAYRVAVAFGPWLQWLVVLLWVGAVLVARRWATAIMGVGLALAISAVVLGAGVAAGRAVALGGTAGTLTAEVVGVVYDALTASIAASVLAAVVTGVAVALVAWLAGPSRTSASLRRLADAGADAIRAAGERHGLGTGRVGELLHLGRLAIRVAVGLVAAAIVLFVRPLTPAIIVWTLVLALLVVALARVLERPAEAPTAPA